MFLNLRGDLVSSHLYQTDHNIRYFADTFRKSLITTQKFDRCPVNIINNICYIHLALNEIFIVIVSDGNDDCFLYIQYLVRLLQIIQAYYESISESVIKENFAAIQEIVDETLDFGYPFLTEKACLVEFISNSGIKENILKNQGESDRITRKITGAVPWREDELYFPNNEVFLDVFEDVNLLLSSAGDVLQSDVVGKIVMKSFLSGMPKCELTLDTCLYSDTMGKNLEDDSLTLSDVSFHTCVRFNKLSEARYLRFVPPDGSFTLMQYRSSKDFILPLTINSPRLTEVSKTRTEVQFHLKSDADPHLNLNNVEVIIPCPENTITVNLQVPKGQAKFQVSNCTIVWKLASLGGGEEIAFYAEMRRFSSTVESAHVLLSRPLINIAFDCVSHSISVLKVVGLKVEEPVLKYNSNKWVRHICKAGKYQCHI
ncbi:unnamed protein product [Phytomonas sp. Hart1]|nr:unnamed protein product [Phytomonas sp. Hart1]|eukprot:CCW66874.1 unnamed protein product [Phytomonas sp. isolate Hart1]